MSDAPDTTHDTPATDAPAPEAAVVAPEPTPEPTPPKAKRSHKAAPKLVAAVPITIPDAVNGGEQTIPVGGELPDSIPPRTVKSLIQQGAAHLEGEPARPLAWNQETPA